MEVSSFALSESDKSVRVKSLDKSVGRKSDKKDMLVKQLSVKVANLQSKLTS